MYIYNNLINKKSIIYLYKIEEFTEPFEHAET